MDKRAQNIKFFMYCRKSSDAEDRQVQSIPDQISALQEVARRKGIEIVEILHESRSAKAPGRPVFNEMITRIGNGEADGILAWKLNRLARNPIDGGKIQWLLQDGILSRIETHDRSYYPSDNVLMMSVEFGMANQYVRDLSIDTKRGLRAREDKKGYPNGVAPMGYLNDMSREPGDRGWIVDEDRFPLVKQLLEMFATGRYSIRQIMKIANDEMGLRSPVHKRQGGKRLCLSYMAGTFLRNPVYAGFFFVGDGSRRELNSSVPRAISEETYWHIQKILGWRGRPRPSLNKDLFPYKRFCTCGTCKGSITADEKHQIICSSCRHKFARGKRTECPKCQLNIGRMDNPTYLHYTYYGCTKKTTPSCPERRITGTEIDLYLAAYFKGNLAISKDLAEWCINNLDQLGEMEQQTGFEKKASLEKTLSKKENERRELILMKTRGLLTDEDFLIASASLKAEIESLQGEISKVEHSDINGQERARKAFNLASGIADIFEHGTVAEKVQALEETGSNLIIKDKKASIYHTELYSLFVKGLQEARAVDARFEPEKTLANKDDSGVFAAVRPTLLRG